MPTRKQIVDALVKERELLASKLASLDDTIAFLRARGDSGAERARDTKAVKAVGRNTLAQEVVAALTGAGDSGLDFATIASRLSASGRAFSPRSLRVSISRLSKGNQIVRVERGQYRLRRDNE